MKNFLLLLIIVIAYSSCNKASRYTYNESVYSKGEFIVTKKAIQAEDELDAYFKCLKMYWIKINDELNKNGANSTTMPAYFSLGHSNGKVSQFLLPARIIDSLIRNAEESCPASAASLTNDLFKFFKRHELKYESCSNDIMKQELNREREKELLKYNDSLIIFKNLSGQIKNISLENGYTGKAKIVTYDIILSKDSPSVSFSCSHVVGNDKVETDYLYNSLKNLGNNQTVHFDGVFALNIPANTPECRQNEYSFSLNYQFHIINISSEELPGKLTPAMSDVLQLGKKGMDDLGSKYRNEEYSVQEFDQNAAKFNELKANLTKDEADYIQRYMDARYMDFVSLR